MGISSKGKRKIVVNEKVYWWFAKEDNWREPLVHIVSEDRTFIALCNLHCPALNIIKDNSHGRRTIFVPDEIEESVFTPKFISSLIHLGTLSK